MFWHPWNKINFSHQLANIKFSKIISHLNMIKGLHIKHHANLRHHRFWLKTPRMSIYLWIPILEGSLRFCSLSPTKSREEINIWAENKITVKKGTNNMIVMLFSPLQDHFCTQTGPGLSFTYIKLAKFSKIKIKTTIVLVYLDIHNFCDFPQVNKKTNENADLHHKVGFVVQNVQQHNKRLKHPKYNRAHRQPFQRLSAVPELDI